MSLEDRDSVQTAPMCDTKQEGPGAREPACLLCRRVEADPDVCGDKLQKGGLCAHVFCMFFASLLFPQETETDGVGLMGFHPRDLITAVWRAAQKRCCVCGQSGATIMCCKEYCEKWFHLPCAKDGGCVNQYITPFSSFCSEHRPEQEVQATPEPDTVCPICMEPVEDRKSFTTLVCPACQRAWFHRDCIQGQAMRAGLLCLQCPLCRDTETFLVDMFVLGIRVPIRQPTWEDNDAFADLGVRHGQCNARECLYPGGREEAEEEGPWALLLCSSCAAEGTHRRCSRLRNSTQIWECDSCAGFGTASRDELELNGPRLARQSGLGPSHGSLDLEAFNTSSHSRRPLGLARRIPSAETHNLNRPQHAAWQQALPSSWLDSSSPSTSRSTYSSSPDRADRRAGLGRGRSRSRRQGRARNRLVRLRSRLSRSSRRRPRAERPRRRETPAQASPPHNRSLQQGWAQSPRVRSRSRCDRSSGTGPRAERPRHRETSSGPSPRRSRSRQPSQAPHRPVRSRSHRDRSSRTRPRGERPGQRETPSPPSLRHSLSLQQGWAQSPRVRSRSRHDRSSRTGPRAERPRPRGTPAQTSPRRSRSRQRGWAQSPPVRSRSRRDRRSGTGPRAERPRHRDTSSGPSPRRSRSRQRGWAQSPPVRSRSRRDRSSRTRARTERPSRRDTSSGMPPRRSRSRQQRRASTHRVRSRSRQDRSRRTAASAERPRRRGTWSGTSRRSSRSHQRRRTSTGTSNSST